MGSRGIVGALDRLRGRSPSWWMLPFILGLVILGLVLITLFRDFDEYTSV